MAAILNSAILDSDTLLSSLRFTQKNSLSTLTLTQTNSIQLTRWWQPSWILPSWIQPCCTKLWPNLIQSDSNLFNLTELDDGSHLKFYHLGFSLYTKKFTHAFSLKFMMAAILNSAILDSAILHKKNFTCSFWLNLIMAAILNFAILDSAILHKKTSLCQDWFPLFTQKNLFILTQLDDGSHLEFYHVGFRHCHLEFRHLVIFSQIHSKTLSLHSDSDSN